MALATEDMESLLCRSMGSTDESTIVYLPGSHGDWTLVTGLRNKLATAGCRVVEFTYPRTTTWSVSMYAGAITAKLADQGITEGWLLAESFGSQPAWTLAQPEIAGIKSNFHVQGLILAGGFVRHPFPWGVSLFHDLCGRMLKGEKDTARMVRSYERWTRMFYEPTLEKETSLEEFAGRRSPTDASAALHRLRLIRENDPRPLAKATRIPVYYLGGVWDPLVPWYLVCPWLRHHCPGYQKGKLLFKADHNVLYSAPTKSAQTILKWLGR